MEKFIKIDYEHETVYFRECDIKKLKFGASYITIILYPDEVLGADLVSCNNYEELKKRLKEII